MEQSLISSIQLLLTPHPRVPLGSGDDAAVLDVRGTNQLVISTDMLTDKVDFDLHHDAAQDVGRKALAVNLSDIAAMAAKPVAAVASVVLPKRQEAEQLALGVVEGLLALAREYDVALAGGDVNSWDGDFAISVTIFGDASEKGVLRRDGAKLGDAILVTGELGGSFLGKQFHFQPRVTEMLELFENHELTAGLDISDGLTLDLARLCQASGCGASLDLTKIPISQAAEQMAERTDAEVAASPIPRKTALEHALTDGEDFEILFTAPHPVAAAILRERQDISQLGVIVEQQGLWSAQDGAPIPERGWEHGL